MFAKDEFSKREKITEDLHNIFGKLEISSNMKFGIGSIIESEIPFKDMLNPKTIEKLNKNSISFPGRINTYPFGEPTGIIYQSFLAICNKKSAFRQTLTAMVNHGIKYGDRIHEMVMMTNFWDSKDFKEYEESFNALYEKFGIKTLVILVTEYSVNIVF